jgi:integrase
VSCLEVALERLESREIKQSTYDSYLKTLRLLELEDVEFANVTVRLLNSRLNRILTESTRRKHAINLRACLGIKLTAGKIKPKEYDLPSVAELHETFEDSPYRIQAFTMLYAGARLGESVIKQSLRGNVIVFDRQRTVSREIISPKSSGPVTVPKWFAEEYRSTPEEAFERQHCSIYNGMQRWSIKMLGRGINPHQLRHRFATSLVDMGASPRVLQAQMRHHHVNVSLQYYVQVRQQDVSELMEKF